MVKSGQRQDGSDTPFADLPADRAARNGDSYEKQKIQARDPDPKIRAALAAAPDTLPEILYYLAEDNSELVRHKVALNDQAPRQADLLLTQDASGDIRGDLAAKIARLTPELPADRRTTLYKLTVRALEALAEDQMVRVREILSNALKDVANAPASVILTLAKDRELSVAQPILEFSPVLSDRDLMEIINSGPIQGAMGAIAKRRALRDTISDVIARSGDEEAVAALLSNDSAQIREDTLDFIIDRAPQAVSWHEPLTMRPRLSPRAVQRIASFVAMNLLDRMQKRLDLDDATLIAVADTVERRLAEDSARQTAEPEWASADNIGETVEQMYKVGELSAETLESALARGEKRFVLYSVARLSGLPIDTIHKIVANRSAKAVVALSWKAGLTPHFASQMQAQVLGLSPKEMIVPHGEQWPLSVEAMQWQIDFYVQSQA